MPRKTPMAASEMMKDGARNTIELKPTKTAQATATHRPRATATGEGSFAFMSIAMMQDDSPMLAPTEMSKLPEMMRMVAPEATTPRVEICSKMLTMLFTLKKRGFTTPVKAEVRSTTMRRRNHWLLTTPARALCLVSSMNA